MTPKEIYKTILTSLTNTEAKDNILLKGMPGVAKTAVIKQAAAEAGYELLIVHGVTSDPIDGKGLPAIINDPLTMEQSAEFLPFGDMKRIINAKEPLLVFLDDIGQAPKAVQAAWMQPLHDRALNGFKVPDCVRFIAATNRREDRAGVSGVISALVSRFPINVTIEPDLQSWAEYSMTDETINPTVVSFARFVHQGGDPVFKFDPSAELENPSVPRTLTALGRLHKCFGDSIALELIQGCIGEAMGTKFKAFMDTYRKLPNPDSIFLNPEAAPVPDRADVQPDEFNALFFGILGLTQRSRHIGFIAAVEAFYRGRALTDRRAHAVHCGIAAANDHNALPGSV